MRKIYNALLLAALVVGLHAEPAWQTDFEAAKAQAKKENKPLLLDFTGSDWCGVCIKLKRAVWDKPEFEKYAKKNLVLVELDFPMGKKLPADIQKQNDRLREKYSIEGYPTVLVLDSEGKEIDRMVGYDDENAAAYVKLIDKIVAKQKSK